MPASSTAWPENWAMRSIDMVARLLGLPPVPLTQVNREPAAVGQGLRPWRKWLLTQGEGVHRAALGPQRVDAALELERRVLSDIAVVDFGVVADLGDRVVGP